MSQPTASRWSRWIHPGKILYTGIEWTIMRILFAIVLFASFRLAGYHAFNWSGSPGRGPDFFSTPKPRGIAQFMDVTWINHAEHIPQVAMALGILLILFVLGVAPILSAAGLLLLQTVLGTLENSQGNNIWHTSQILAYGLLGLLIASIANCVSICRKEGWKSYLSIRWQWPLHVLKNPAALFRHGSDAVEAREEKSRSLSIYLVQQLMATGYVVSGISKLWISKGTWFSDVQNIALQFEKTRLQRYYETLQEPQVWPGAADAVNQFPLMASFLFSIGLFLELFAFVALFNRLFLALFGIGIMVMHLMIAKVMLLEFDYNEWMLVIFYINIPFWLLYAARRGKLKAL
jgi:hypothetical protein